MRDELAREMASFFKDRLNQPALNFVNVRIWNYGDVVRSRLNREKFKLIRPHRDFPRTEIHKLLVLRFCHRTSLRYKSTYSAVAT